jgi:hypothetical protein
VFALFKFCIFRGYHNKLIKEQDPSSSSTIIILHELNDFFRQSDWDKNGYVDALNFVEEKFGTGHSPQSYQNIVKAASAASQQVDQGSGKDMFLNGSALYFHATVVEGGKSRITLHPPEEAADTRIYRKYGSHRFLHLHVSEKITKGAFGELVSKKLYVCGRKYSYFWSKATKSPQCFVFFAESGVGIEEEEEYSAADVREWCIPKGLNSELTLAKELKRIKLSFSKTTPSGILPHNSVELKMDIVSDSGAEMTDGGGILSREALDFIWRNYEEYHIKKRKALISHGTSDEVDIDLQVEIDECVYTSLQGRIGGMKGVWVLDPILEGFTIICRDSQHKYKLPMKCLTGLESTSCNDVPWDEAYDTVDVCCWHKAPETAFLNCRLIQILEHRGADVSYFDKCADDGMSWLRDIANNERELLKHLDRRHTAVGARLGTNDYEDDKLLYRMARVNVNRNEPMFKSGTEKMIRSEAKNMRNKVSSSIEILVYHLVICL